MLIAVSLLACLLCPFVEIVVQSNDSIFNDGYDTESTVALLLLVFELGLMLPFLVLLLPSSLKKEQPLTSDQRSGSSPRFAAPFLQFCLPLRT